MALFPFNMIGKNNKNNLKHIKSYQGLAALKILEETGPKSENNDAFDELITSLLKKNLKGHVKNEIMVHHGLFLKIVKSVFSVMLSKRTEIGDKQVKLPNSIVLADGKGTTIDQDPTLKEEGLLNNMTYYSKGTPDILESRMSRMNHFNGQDKNKSKQGFTTSQTMNEPLQTSDEQNQKNNPK